MTRNFRILRAQQLSSPASAEVSGSPSPAPSSIGNNAPKYGTLVPNRVFVGGISGSTTEQDLLELFSQYGQVKATKIISDRAGVSKGYGFVTFETEDEARRLTQEADNIMLKDRKLNIAPAIKKQVSDVGYMKTYSPRLVDSGSAVVGSGGTVFFGNGAAAYTAYGNTGVPILAAATPQEYHPTFPQAQQAPTTPTYQTIMYPQPVYFPQTTYHQYQQQQQTVQPQWGAATPQWRWVTPQSFPQPECNPECVVDGSGDTPQRVETPSSVTPTAGNSPVHHTTPRHSNPAPTTTCTSSASISMSTMTPGGSHIVSPVTPVSNSQENHLLIEPLSNLAINKHNSSPTTDANNNNPMMHKESTTTIVALAKNETDNNNNAEGSSKVGGAASVDVTSPNSQQMSHPDSSVPETMVAAQQQLQTQPNMLPPPLQLTDKRAAQSSSSISSQGEAPTSVSSSSKPVEQQNSSMYSGSVAVCSNNPRMSVSLEAAASSPIKTPGTMKASSSSNAVPLCSSNKCGVTCSRNKCQQSAISGTSTVGGQCCGSGGLPSNRSSSLSNLLPSANMSAPPAGLSSLGGPLGGWSSNNSSTSWCPQHSGGTVGSPVAAAVCGSPMQGSQSWTGLGWPHSPVMRSSSTTSLDITRAQTSCQHHKNAASPRSTSLPPPPRSTPVLPLQQPPPRAHPTSPTNSSCSTSSMRTSSVPPGPPQP
ncbi:unnamed protein product, partial [Meganyctiphanes norvegica]